MDRVPLLVGYRTTAIGRLAGDIKDTAEHALADRNGNRSAERIHFHAACEAFGGAHGDRTNPMLTEVLLHFESEILFLAADFKVDFKRVVDFGQSAVCRVELDIDNGADDLDDSSFVIHVWLLSVKRVICVASADSERNSILGN